MDPLQTEQGGGWAQVGPLIAARQRDMAERVAAEAAQAASDPSAKGSAHRVVAPERSARSVGAVSGEAGLGARSGADDADKAEAKTDARGLTEAEQDLVADLKARDAEVRRHEQAHAAVGGQYAGTPTYTFQTGPDGQRYAVGGAVAIDVSPVDGDPEATIDKMEMVKAAALAPAEPSAADRQVAALADAQRAQAVADLSALRRGAAQEGQIDTRI